MLITKEMRYINLPSSRTAEKSRLYFYENSKLVFDIDVCLDFENPDCVMPYDIGNFIDRDIEIKGDMAEKLTFCGEYRKPGEDVYRPEK